VSTHLISEFEGLIDEFTIVDHGRNVLTLNADLAREHYQKIRVRFADTPPQLDLHEALQVRRDGRELEVIANGGSAELKNVWSRPIRKR
jgi:ABC-type multidrug transport system ATPase subunit